MGWRLFGRRFPEVFCAIGVALFAATVAAGEATIQSLTPDDGSELISELEGFSQEILKREAQYRALDYASAASNEEGYLRALRNAEMNALLSSVYLYARYQSDLPTRIEEGRSILALDSNVRLSPGLAQKKHDSEKALARLYSRNFSLKSTQRDVFEWRRSLFLARLANLSEALVRCDEALGKEESKSPEAQSIAALRNELLSEEPLLAKMVSSPVDAGDVRPLYVFVFDIYRRIPSNVVSNADSLLLRSSGISEGHLMAIRRTATQEREWVTQFAEASLAEFLSHRAEIVPVSVFEEILDRFPGGMDRYLYLLKQVQEMTPEESFEKRVRDELALQVVEPALQQTIQTLTSEMLKIPSRTFSDYAGQPAFRAAVLSSFPADLQTRLANTGKTLLESQSRKKTLNTAKEVAFYSVIAGSYLLQPPKRYSALLWLGRLMATGLHGYERLQDAREFVRMTQARVTARLNSYEWIGLAQSQYRLAITLAVVDVALPVRFGGTIARVEKSLARVLLGMARNPKTGVRAVQIGLGQEARPVIAFFRTLANGRTLLTKLSANIKGAFNEMVSIGKAISKMQLAGEVGAINLMRDSALRKAFINSASSGMVVVLAEWMNRGSDFTKQPGFYRNLVISVLDDGCLAFFGLGSFTAVERLMTVGGATFTMSVLGQVLTNVRDPAELLGRASFDMAFVLSISLWKLQIVNRGVEGLIENQAKLALLNKIPAKGFEFGSNLLSFFGNNLAGNYLYSLSTVSLLEDPLPKKEVWWPNESPEKPHTILANTPGWWDTKKSRSWF